MDWRLLLSKLLGLFKVSAKVELQEGDLSLEADIGLSDTSEDG